MEITSYYFAKRKRGKYLTRDDNGWTIEGKNSATIFNSREEVDTAILEYNEQINRKRVSKDTPLEIFGFEIVEFRVPDYF